MPRQIDYYFSLSSPWTYIGHATFRKLVEGHALKVNYKPVTLLDLFSETGGLPLVKRHPVRQRYRMLFRPTCSARRSISWAAKCSGDRTVLNCSPMH